MRRTAWLLGLVMMFTVLRPVLAAPMFPDVPDMWAKDAVAALAAKGILEGYPDGTFKGDRAATRYEVAMIVARLLAKMEQEHATFATKADLDELRRLVNQLKEELDALGVRVQNLEDNVAKLDKRVTELERITFYGSLDVRYVSMRMSNRGITSGLNGTTLGSSSPIIIAGGVVSPNPAIAGGVGAVSSVTSVGVPYFAPALAAAGQGSRPVMVYAFPFNTASANSAANYNLTATPVANPSYNAVVGANYSLGGGVGGVALGGNPFTGLTGAAGRTFAVPMVLPTFELRTGRPWTNGQGFSGQGILGVRIKLNEDMDAGAEFAAYYSSGDPIVDSFYGVSARRLSNVFAGNQGLNNYDAGQGIAHNPWTRMNIDNFWFLHKPSNVKLQVGSYGDTMMDSIVYVPEYNPNYWGPKYLDNFGMRVSGSHHAFAKIDWEVFGSNVATGNNLNSTYAGVVAATGATDYKPFLWGADIKFTFGEEGNTGRIKFNLLRMWDDNSSGSASTVGSIVGMNGVWLDWANPAGFFAAQLNPAGPSDPNTSRLVAGIGSTSDVRPIIPNMRGNTPYAYGTDQSGSGLFGATSMAMLSAVNAVQPIPGGVNPVNTYAPTSSFGPQSMFTWGLSGGWDYTMNDDWKWRFLAEYGNSSYKPSQNSSYNAPTGEAWRIGLGVTMFKDFDLDGEYVSTNPYYNPYIMQYPNVNGVTQSYWRIPTMSWMPEAYPVNDKDVYPNNRNGFRVFFKWNPVNEKDGKRTTAFWGEYGNMDQNQTSLQNIRYSPGCLGIGTVNVPSTWTPNGYVLGFNPGWVDTVFTGYSPLSYAGYTGALAASSTNQFATPLENPRGRVTNWGLGVNYKFAALNNLGLHVAYKDWQFQRNTSLNAAQGGSMNNINLQMTGGIVALQYPINERFAVKGGYAWTTMKGHYDPTGVFQNFAVDTGAVGFQTVNTEQTSPFVGFDYDIARNVNWNMTAKWLDSKDKLGTFNSTNFFMQRSPFSWSGLQVTSEVKVSF